MMSTNGFTRLPTPGVQTVPPLPLQCCLIENGVRCPKVAASYNYAKRFEKIVAQKKLNIVPDKSLKHTNMRAHHRRLLLPPQSAKTSRKARAQDSGDEQENSSHHVERTPKIRFDLLPAATLRRYKKFFKVQTSTGLNKQQLADALAEHLQTIPVNEKEILTYFIYMVKTNKNRLDSKINCD